MNIDTSSSNVNSASTSTSNVQSNSKSEKSNSSSFEEEMKSASTKEEQKNSKIEENTQTATATTDEPEKASDDIVTAETLRGELNFTDYKYHNESQSILNRNIQSLLNTRDLISFNNADFSTLKTSLDYQSVSMDENDAMFFTDLVKNTDMSIQSIASNLQQLSEVSVQAAEKTAKVSSTMMNLLAESVQTNKPFRIDFDKDISVIIKVNRDGSIMANFIPGDKAVEEYLKNNIGFLKQRFDEENLSYSQLSYSKHKQQEQQKQNKKENADE